MKFLKILGSVKITSLILPLMIIELIIITFLPDGNKWFLSVYFLIPLFLFFFNLSACTILRIAKKKTYRYPLNGGPDIIHIGIIILVICGILSPLFREEISLSVNENDQIELTPGNSLRILNLDFSTYTDGRPQNWTVKLQAGNEVVILSVNRPLKVGRVMVYLTGFGTTPNLVLEKAGTQIKISQNQGLTAEEEIWTPVEYRQLEDGGWAVRLSNGAGIKMIQTGDKIDDYIFSGVYFGKEAVLMLVRNPLRPMMYISFSAIFCGFILLITHKFIRRK